MSAFGQNQFLSNGLFLGAFQIVCDWADCRRSGSVQLVRLADKNAERLQCQLPHQFRSLELIGWNIKAAGRQTPLFGDIRSCPALCPLRAQLSSFRRLTLVPGSCHCLKSMQSHHNGNNWVVTRESILYNSTRYLRASINVGTTFATRRSNAPSTSPVVGVFSIMEMSASGWKADCLF